MQKISIVVPVYYNEGSLPLLHQRFAQCALKEPEYNFEFIFVDDGSGDRSVEVLSALSEMDNRIKIVKLLRNFGATIAVMAGLAHASGDAVAVISADLQDPPEIILEMLAHWKRGVPTVYAARSNRDDPASVKVPASVFNWAFRRFAFKNWPRDGFDCFLIDRKVVNVVNQCEEKNTHLPGLLMWSGFPYQMIYYERQKREHGKSRWNLQRRLKYLADAFTSFSYFPVRICSALGVIVAVLGLLYAFVVLTLTLLGFINIEGWSSLMIVVLVTSGLQMVMLGVLGEYLWRNSDETRRRPLYIVDRVIGQVAPDERGLDPSPALSTTRYADKTSDELSKAQSRPRS